nr:uncharacterized protein LOC107279401 [Oryza sativa Japonica Group]
MVTCDGKPRAWLPTVEGDGGGGGGDGGSCCGGGSCRGGGSGWGSSSSGGGGGGRVVGNNGGCCNGSMVGADTAMSHPKSIHKCRPSPFRHKPHKRQCTSPGSHRPQQRIRPLTCNCKLNRLLPKYILNRLAKCHIQWQKGLRLCRRSSKLSFNSSANPTTFQLVYSRANSQEKLPTRSRKRLSTYFTSLTGSQGARRIASDGKQYKPSTIRPPSPLLKPNNKFKLPNHLLSWFASPSRRSKDNCQGKVKPP